MNARNAYLGQMITTASPARLLIMLFERLALDVTRAEDAQGAGDFAEASRQLIHAQEIVLELMGSLDTDVWDGAERIGAVYRFLYQRLITANTTRDVAVTGECRRIVEPLVEMWREAALASVGG